MSWLGAMSVRSDSPPASINERTVSRWIEGMSPGVIRAAWTSGLSALSPAWIDESIPPSRKAGFGTLRTSHPSTAFPSSSASSPVTTTTG